MLVHFRWMDYIGSVERRLKIPLSHILDFCLFCCFYTQRMFPLSHKTWLLFVCITVIVPNLNNDLCFLNSDKDKYGRLKDTLSCVKYYRNVAEGM